MENHLADMKVKIGRLVEVNEQLQKRPGRRNGPRLADCSFVGNIKMSEVTIYEGFPSRETVSGGDSPSVLMNWIVLGTSSNSEAVAAVRATHAGDLWGVGSSKCHRQGNRPENLGMPSEVWCSQTAQGRASTSLHSTRPGGHQKITQSLETVHKYAPSGKTAADHKGAIGVTDHGVEGCDIIVPKFSWTETWQLPIADYGWAYSQVLKAATGRVNASEFRGFPAGQVLFKGGKGSASSKDPTLIEISYAFDQSDDVTAQTIGDITGIAKTGWQYLWVQIRRDRHDATAKDYVRRPKSVYVERVYDSVAFATLGIGA